MKKALCVFVLLAAAGLSLFGADPNVLAGYDGQFKGGYLLKPKFLYDMKTEDLALMRNEIFARYGRAFATPAYKTYFSTKRWYKVNSAYSDTLLTDTDNANINLILSFEKPALTEADMRKAVLGVIEYTNDQYSLVFSDPTTAIIRSGTGFYAESQEELYTWSVAGDWILCTNGAIHALFRLDHVQQRIVDMEWFQG